jgi:8-oxo-dGTP diphosphatase
MSMLVACAVLVKDKKVLLTQRPLYKSQGGKWEFPGGKLNENESASACIVREIFEELNSEMTVTRELEHVNHDYSAFSIELIPLLGMLNTSNIILTEHINMKWCTFKELLELDICDADKKILSQLHALLA